MKTKNLVTLVVAALVVVLLAVVCLTGIQVGKYILIPAADGITRGNEFAKSTYVVLNVNEPAAEVSDEAETAGETEAEAVPASAELYDETIAIMRRRAQTLTLGNIAVMEQGENRIRIEMPTEVVTDASNILYTLTQPCHIYITNADGEIVLEGEDIVSSEMGVDSTGSYYYISFKVEEEALSEWGKATEDVNANATVWLDGVEMNTAPISQLLSTGMFFTDYGSAVTMGMALETGHITANLTTEASGNIPAKLTEANFDGAMIAIAVAVLVAAIVMIVVFKGLGVVSALSIVLGAVAVTYFFGCVPYIKFGAAGFFALAAALGVKVLCDIDLMTNVNKALASEDIVGKEAASAAWRVSGLRTLEICGVAIGVALVAQYFGGAAVTAFTSVFALGSFAALLITVIFTRPLVTCIVDKPAKESK